MPGKGLKQGSAVVGRSEVDGSLEHLPRGEDVTDVETRLALQHGERSSAQQQQKLTLLSMQINSISSACK